MVKSTWDKQLPYVDTARGLQTVLDPKTSYCLNGAWGQELSPSRLRKMLQKKRVQGKFHHRVVLKSNIDPPACFDLHSEKSVDLRRGAEKGAGP